MTVNSIKNYFSPATWEKIDHNINLFSDDFMLNSVLPTLKSAYFQAGQRLSHLGGLIRPEWAKKIEVFWKAPISIETAFKVLTTAEKLLKSFTLRTPCSMRGIGYLDQTCISMAQHLYPFVKESHNLITLPQRLNKYCTHFDFDQFYVNLANYFGRFWGEVAQLLITLKKVILFVLDYLIRALDCVFQCLVLNPELHIFEWMKDIILEARSNVRGHFADQAKISIDRKTEEVRQQATSSVMNYSVNYVGYKAGRLGFKLAAATAFIASLHFPVIQLGGITGLAYATWRGNVKPYLDSYHDTFRSTFQPKEQYLKKFVNRYTSVKPYYWELKLVKKFI